MQEIVDTLVSAIKDKKAQDRELLSNLLMQWLTEAYQMNKQSPG